MRPLVRTADPETSRAAARTVAPHLSDQQMRVHRVLWVARQRGGLTDSEICRVLNTMHPGSVIKRRGELVDAGLVEFSGEYRPSPSGCAQRVWRLVK